MTDALMSPLHDAHRTAGARMTTFAGWRLPLHYGSILTEAKAVRHGAGMFDVSHMGRLEVTGTGAIDLLQHLGTNDLRRISPGRAQYTLWCTGEGGVVDDLIVLWLGEGDFLVVVNGARRDDDLAHVESHRQGFEAVVDDVTLDTAMIAVQGPDGVAAVDALAGGAAAGLRRFGAARMAVCGADATVSRTGYTGEDGVEIVCAAAHGPAVWEALVTKGVVPCGLGARDALRMEMGYPLYGHELSLQISPLEAGVGFAVRLEREGFVGRDALAAASPHRHLAGFVCASPCVPAPGDPVGTDGAAGTVTSGGTSVVLGKPIGLALFDAPVSSPAAGRLRNRGKDIVVQVRPLPLIERGRPGA